MGNGVLSSGFKCLRRQADHSPPSSVEVKNKWSYTRTPHPHMPSWLAKGQFKSSTSTVKRYGLFITVMYSLAMARPFPRFYYARSQNCEKRLWASSCLSAWNNSAPTGRIFMKFDTLSIFRNSVEKIRVLLKLYKNTGYSTWRPLYIFDHISLGSP
jgi:hypothetical protein